MLKAYEKQSIKDIKIISEETKEFLKNIAVHTLGDLNLFSVSQYQSIFAECSEDVLKDIKTLLTKNYLPEKIQQLFTENEVIKFFKESGFTDLKSILTAPRSNLFQILKDDDFLLAETNQLFVFFGQTPLTEADFDEKLDLVSSQTKVAEINVAERLKSVDDTHITGSKLYRHMRIRLASPDEIRTWSYGEVKSHETINYRTAKPEVGGLFCEKIFGPTKDFQCACGKKQSGNKGQICQKCGIEITESLVRRERMGHIELKSPVVHTWFFKNSPSRLAILLGIKAKSLEEVVNYAAYIVTDPGNTPLKRKQILSEQDYAAINEEYYGRFQAQTGAEAIQTLLKALDLDHEIRVLRKKFRTSTKQKRQNIIKRLEIVEAFYSSDNRPEWIVMPVIPVIPPDLRPMVQLDGGRFATTDLNDLYCKIINRNNRLKKELDQFTTSLILKNEKRLIQEAVDSLFDNSKRGNKKALASNARPLKSLSDLLRGKQGRFRQNLLGKRVDYSGRSVIIVGPNLKMYQAGIPREMAITLFKPFVINRLQENLEVTRQKSVEMYDNRTKEVWQVLEEVVREHPVLLNRAPTLHRLSIQAFEPKLIDGKAIRLHPLATTAFNADFDGDQMAVHLPLSPEAQAEARLLMLASNNILNPKDGKPVVTPSQDMVLGNYFLTTEERYIEADPKTHQHRNEGMLISSIDEAKNAQSAGIIDYHTRILVRPQILNRRFTADIQGKLLITTLGKLIFNEIMPDGFFYLNEPTEYNLTQGVPQSYLLDCNKDPKVYFAQTKDQPLPEPFKKSFLGKIIDTVFKHYDVTRTSVMLDDLKDLGFKYSTVSAVTISYDDIKVYSNKAAILKESQAKIEQITNYFNMGMLTDKGRSRQIINVWENTKTEISRGLERELNRENPIYVMSDSGARGNIQNFVQLAGMRGILNNPKGEQIEVPVKSSFKEGLTVSEFFISTHGARKGSTDTALKTAQSGYLTRRLVDVAQGVIITLDDCGTENGVFVKDILDKDQKVVCSLEERLHGRFAAQKAYDKNNLLIVDRNELITQEAAAKIAENYSEFKIRTNLTCSAIDGLCVKCYGLNLATNSIVEVGEAVGVVAAQSIGEPGTQLTMRTFHTGGVASASDITQGLPRIQELFEARTPKGKSVISEYFGKVSQISRPQYGQPSVVIEDRQGKTHTYSIESNADILVKVGDSVQPGTSLTPGSIHPKELLRVTDTLTVSNYILAEVRKVYQSQGVDIQDKHIEIIIRQMLKRIMIIHEGDTNLLPGIVVSNSDFLKANRVAFEQGTRPAIGKRILLGITRASLSNDSFLSAASFQETTRILTDAAISSRPDQLKGLKENVIIGGLIPAGTGILKETEFNYTKVSDDKNA